MAKKGMKVGTFISKVTSLPRPESLNKLTEKERATYEKLKAKVTELNPVELEYSRLFENKNVKGVINISIDPIDYLLMSVNDSNWNSCYALVDSSHESRSYNSHVAGVFSYMCDPSTLIAYRHNGIQKEMKIGNSTIKEYSKNWRQVIYLDTKTYGFACSRQYPNDDDTLAKHIRELLEETISQNLNIQNLWKTKRITGSETLRKKVLREEPLHGDRLSYNDIINRGEGFFVCNPVLGKIKDIRLYTDSNPICPLCGENVLDKPSRPICRSCREKEGVK